MLKSTDVNSVQPSNIPDISLAESVLIFFVSTDSKEVQSSKKPSKTTTSEVSNFDKSTDFNDLHLANIFLIDLTLAVLKSFPYFIEVKPSHPSNNEFIFSTFLVSNLLKSISVKEEHPVNSCSILVKFFVLNLSP